MSTRTRQFYRAIIWVALLALPFCLMGSSYWWWRLGMLWTPDELPGIQFRFRLWVGLAAFTVALAASAIILLRRTSRENAA